jgi:hypothetical protein
VQTTLIVMNFLSIIVVTLLCCNYLPLLQLSLSDHLLKNKKIDNYNMIQLKCEIKFQNITNHYIKRKIKTKIESTFLGPYIFCIYTHFWNMSWSPNLVKFLSNTHNITRKSLPSSSPNKQTLTKMGPTPRDSLAHMDLPRLLVDFLISFKLFSPLSSNLTHQLTF